MQNFQKEGEGQTDFLMSGGTRKFASRLLKGVISWSEIFEGGDLASFTKFHPKGHVQMAHIIITEMNKYMAQMAQQISIGAAMAQMYIGHWREPVNNKPTTTEAF